MGATDPATGTPLAFFELTAETLNVLLAHCGGLYGLHPADPLVARERGDVFPEPPRSTVFPQSFA